MAINADGKLKNNHTMYIAQSESGKTTAVKKAIENKKRVIFWDTEEEYQVDKRFNKLSEFAAYLAKNGHKKNLRVALSMDSITIKSFEFFCRCVWALADGKIETHIVVEELADVTSPSKAVDIWGQIIRKGRKYNLKLHCITQRPQEIDKTIYTQARRFWVGVMSAFDSPHVARQLKVEKEQIESLKPLEFIAKDGHDLSRGVFKYSNAGKLSVSVSDF